MNIKTLKYMTWVALAGFAGPLLATEVTCDVTPPNSVPCEELGGVWVSVPSRSCPNGEFMWICVLPGGAMPPAALECKEVDGVATCEAYPQSRDVTYRYVWSVLEGIRDDYKSDEFEPVISGVCQGGSVAVSVTVIAPNGDASSAKHSINTHCVESLPEGFDGITAD